MAIRKKIAGTAAALALAASGAMQAPAHADPLGDEETLLLLAAVTATVIAIAATGNNRQRPVSP